MANPLQLLHAPLPLLFLLLLALAAIPSIRSLALPDVDQVHELAFRNNMKHVREMEVGCRAVYDDPVDGEDKWVRFFVVPQGKDVTVSFGKGIAGSDVTIFCSFHDGGKCWAHDVRVFNTSRDPTGCLRREGDGCVVEFEKDDYVTMHLDPISDYREARTTRDTLGRFPVEEDFEEDCFLWVFCEKLPPNSYAGGDACCDESCAGWRDPDFEFLDEVRRHGHKIN